MRKRFLPRCGSGCRVVLFGYRDTADLIDKPLNLGCSSPMIIIPLRFAYQSIKLHRYDPENSSGTLPYRLASTHGAINIMIISDPVRPAGPLNPFAGWVVGWSVHIHWFFFVACLQIWFI